MFLLNVYFISLLLARKLISFSIACNRSINFAFLNEKNLVFENTLLDLMVLSPFLVPDKKEASQR